MIEVEGYAYRNIKRMFSDLAARKLFGINYVVYEENDLKDIGIYPCRESYLKCFYKKYYCEITFYNNSKTKKLKKRIEKWLR